MYIYPITVFLFRLIELYVHLAAWNQKNIKNVQCKNDKNICRIKAHTLDIHVVGIGAPKGGLGFIKYSIQDFLGNDRHNHGDFRMTNI